MSMLQHGWRFRATARPAIAALPATKEVEDAPAILAASDVALGDAASFPDAARSKVAETVRAISAGFAASAAAISKDAAAYKVGSSVSGSALRAIWSACLADDLKARALNLESMRISRQKGQIWIYDPDCQNARDPAAKSYPLQDQPADFDAYMTSWEAIARGFDLSIEHLRKSIARLDRQAAAE